MGITLRHRGDWVQAGTICAAGLLLAVAAVTLIASGRARSPAPSDLLPSPEPEAALAPDFVLRDPRGKAYHLREHLGGGPIVIQFGNFT
jgi:hypothetical protein